MRPRRGLDDALGDGEIDLERLARLPLRAQRVAGGGGACEGDHAGGIAVEAVHEAGARPGDLLHLGVAGAHGVDERDGRAALHRVYQQARLLVDDQRVLVGEQHLERYVERHRVEVRLGGQADRDLGACGHLAAGAGARLAGDLDAAVLDQPLRLAARELRELIGDEPIEAVRARSGEAFELHQPPSSPPPVSPPGRQSDSTASAITPITIEESAMLKAG